MHTCKKNLEITEQLIKKLLDPGDWFSSFRVVTYQQRSDIV